MTTLSRKNQWTNNDGLVVGFGNRFPERQRTSDFEVDGTTKELSLDFTWQSVTPVLDIPAGFVVDSMKLFVGTAWVSTGTVTIEIGDGGDANGWFTTTLLTEANLTADAVLVADGDYAIGDNADNMGNPKVYASADTIDIVVTGAGNAPQQGSARLVVYGVQGKVAHV